MPDSVIHALLGKEPGALGPGVSLATPLTLKRLVGRDQVLSALTTYAGVLGATDADLRLHGEELEGAVFTTTIDGHSAQVLALVTHDDAGQIATIEALEQDYEGKSHLAVVLDDDPGRDMGLLRQPGHRFFFDPEEVEPVK